MNNIVIIGAGICGLTAAVYNARADLAPIVLCGPEDGGQLTQTTDVENFPGFEHGVLGPELVAVTKKQAQRFGAIFVTDIAKSVTKISGGFKIELVNGEPIETKSIIVATGASARWLNLPSEKQFKGRGVSTCATCDGFFYKNKNVIVIGGGDSAMEEATHLAKFAASVTLVHRGDTFRASKIMQDRALSNPKIKVVWNKFIVEYTGEKKLAGVVLEDAKTKEQTAMPIDGVFLAIGHIPNSGFLGDLVDKDPTGYVIADRYTHTKTDGLFAAGDVSDPRYRQAITAAGSGCMASLEAEKYVNGMH